MKKSLSDKVIEAVISLIYPAISPEKIHISLYHWLGFGSSAFYWLILYVLFTCSLFLIGNALGLAPDFFAIAWYSSMWSLCGLFGHLMFDNSFDTSVPHSACGENYPMFLWHFRCWEFCVLISVLKAAYFFLQNT